MADLLNLMGNEKEVLMTIQPARTDNPDRGRSQPLLTTPTGPTDSPPGPHLTIQPAPTDNPDWGQ